MNWLARLDIDAEIARTEKLFDSYAWHKKLWECFPDMPDQKRVAIGFLTRMDVLEKTFRLWVLSKRKPVQPRWCQNDGFALKEIAASFLSYRYYALDLIANPTKRLVQRDPDGKRKPGKRVPLVKLEELRAWLIRKGQVRCRDQDTGLDVQGGFRIMENEPLEILPMGASRFRKDGNDGCHGGVRFRGMLEVTDRAMFVETYQAGIGSAKGFGFGLLLLAPVNLQVNKTNSQGE